jgi:deoxyribodipyrimidine photo-lyase
VAPRLMITGVYWFRNDLRLTDNRSLLRACEEVDHLSLVHVCCDDEVQMNRWGFPRLSPLRRTFRDMVVDGLALALAEKGATLVRTVGAPVAVLTDLARKVGATRIYCEDIPAPEERSDVAALSASGLDMRVTWQSTLLDPQELPFEIVSLPEVFTRFRETVERAAIRPKPPLSAPSAFPPSPPSAGLTVPPRVLATPARPAAHASFPFDDPAFHGSEAAALAHVARYFQSKAPVTYKATRNGLTGPDYSTKLSPWLATGALSPRTVFAALQSHEEGFGASEGSYWIWFELLWRDFFRFWSEKHGAKLFRPEGLGRLSPPSHDPEAFDAWRRGSTGHSFVDAGLRDLAATGYLSNRLRQVTASYLVHDLACDWRAGAAWFESRLIDFDVCSNQGNWLYVAGRGADPRQGRRFNPDKQAADYDADGSYRALWASSTAASS